MEKRYIISDASKMVEVESHVLRYWEDELGIEIPRNELGHRYYTDYYITLFRKIKELKDGGFQLKAIKILLPELMDINSEMQSSERLELLKEELFSKSENSETQLSNLESESEDEKALSKMEQFQSIIYDIVFRAMKENNSNLGKELGDTVSDNVIKEMDYLMHIREKNEEERFRKLDESIRKCQLENKEKSKGQKGFISKFKKGHSTKK